MSDKERHMPGKPERGGLGVGATALGRLRAQIPPVTPRLLLRALLGALLFFCGIVSGAWLIIRFRRRAQDGNAPDA